MLIRIIRMALVCLPLLASATAFAHQRIFHFEIKHQVHVGSAAQLRPHLRPGTDFHRRGAVRDGRSHFARRLQCAGGAQPPVGRDEPGCATVRLGCCHDPEGPAGGRFDRDTHLLYRCVGTRGVPWIRASGVRYACRWAAVGTGGELRARSQTSPPPSLRKRSRK